LVGVLRRGVPISERIRDKIKDITGVEVPVATLDITLYRDDLEELSDMPKVNKHEIEENLTGKIAVIVDDVIFTGRTVRAAIDAIFDVSRPKCIQLVTLVDRGHREIPIRPDYVGKNVPTSLTEIIKVNTERFDGVWSIEIDSKK
ncbi:MAG: bifunctional pyr operon transcriptional regulator/uracil phosphoribosyltransferase PyrR, partial [Clostridia bacterium]|nr:bifunctional pyr operon transcriptional regulator/uracil phosphoribosyltransferase PyrR [Clostridia bacterium]